MTLACVLTACGSLIYLVEAATATIYIYAFIGSGGEKRKVVTCMTTLLQLNPEIEQFVGHVDYCVSSHFQGYITEIMYMFKECYGRYRTF